MIFPEGLKTAEEFAQVADALKGVGSEEGPFLLANMTEFGNVIVLWNQSLLENKKMKAVRLKKRMSADDNRTIKQKGFCYEQYAAIIIITIKQNETKKELLWS